MTAVPVTGQGGHVTLLLEGVDGATLTAMAYEPTKGFRDIVRALVPGDEVTVTGSCKGGSLNLEKLQSRAMADAVTRRPPLCACLQPADDQRRTGTGLQVPALRRKKAEPEVVRHQRSLTCGWDQVPSVARRHLAKPLCRGTRPGVPALAEEGVQGVIFDEIKYSPEVGTMKGCNEPVRQAHLSAGMSVGALVEPMGRAGAYNGDHCTVTYLSQDARGHRDARSSSAWPGRWYLQGWAGSSRT